MCLLTVWQLLHCSTTTVQFQHWDACIKNIVVWFYMRSTVQYSTIHNCSNTCSNSQKWQCNQTSLSMNNVSLYITCELPTSAVYQIFLLKDSTRFCEDWVLTLVFWKTPKFDEKYTPYSYRYMYILNLTVVSMIAYSCWGWAMCITVFMT